MDFPNAIIWYNSSFDILLQTLWIGKEVFKTIEFDGYYNSQVKKDSKAINLIRNCSYFENCDFYKYVNKGESKSYREINEENYIDILKECKIEHFQKEKYNYLHKFKNTILDVKLRPLANSLKHRNGIRYGETYPIPNIAIWTKNGKANPLITEKVDDVIEILVQYHKAFIPLIETVYQEINFHFQKWGFPNLDDLQPKNQ